MNKIMLIVCLIVVMLFVWGCTEEEFKFPEEGYCKEHISELSCDELLECYEYCDTLDFITWQMACRDGFKPRLWKCYGYTE